MILAGDPAASTRAYSSEFADASLRKVSWRLVPLLAILLLVSFIDRTNVGFAALRMQSNLGLSPRQYAWRRAFSSSGTSHLRCRATSRCIA
jgi:MFS transporter, ACS family, tartrate transporter